MAVGSFTLEFWMKSSAGNFAFEILGAIIATYTDSKMTLRFDRGN